MTEVKFTARAYGKIILHAAKYPHCSINGVLLAKSSQASGKEIEFVDAVPLFHVCLNLTPMAEIALMQIDEYAVNRGLVIAGYYTANENLKENSFDKAHHKIADRIAANFSPSFIVVVNNTKLSNNPNKSVLRVAQMLDGNLKPCNEDNIQLSPPEQTTDAVSCLLREKNYQDLVDFDNHLDDISLDWMNVKLNKEIDSFIYGN